MSTLVVVLHIFVCILLIVVILMQSGKGGGLSSAFGGGGGGMAGQMFGGRGAATFLSKVTTVLAALFMIFVILMNLFPGVSSGPRSVIQEEAVRHQQASPAQGLPAVPPAPAGEQPKPETPAQRP